MRARLILILLTATGALSVAGAAAVLGDGRDDEAGPPRPPAPPPQQDRSVSDQLLVELQWFDDIGGRWIGPGYACATLKPRQAQGEYEKLVVFVSDAVADQRARQLTTRLASPQRTLVKRTSPRFRMGVMRRIQRHIDQSLPSNARNVSVGRIGFMDVKKGHCPPIQIAVHAASATPEVERWIADAVGRFGSDRVVVRHSAGKNEPAASRASGA